MHILLALRPEGTCDPKLAQDFGTLLACPGGELAELATHVGHDVAALQTVMDGKPRFVFRPVPDVISDCRALADALEGVAFEPKPFFLGPGDVRPEFVQAQLRTLVDSLEAAAAEGATECAFTGFL